MTLVTKVEGDEPGVYLTLAEHLGDADPARVVKNAAQVL